MEQEMAHSMAVTVAVCSCLAPQVLKLETTAGAYAWGLVRAALAV